VTYEAGASVEVHALHVMPMEGPEGVLHGHDYRIDVVASRERLDGDGMVVDLAALEAELKSVRAELEGRDLETIRPLDTDAVTVEVFARWVWDRLAPVVAAAGADELAVRVYESAGAFGGYGGRVT
jgi:6-pyruvoyltetrahydropterin/6-carboxytetrahydropterin synthase